jgi:uncharacterized ParB-like nuclease family protein
MNYLQLVNNVLRRLREGEVSSVSDTPYSKMIGEFVNDAKRQVEDAYSWNALTETLSATTATDIFNYVLVGSGQRFKVMDVLNDTTNSIMQNATSAQMNDWYVLSDNQKGKPYYYNFNGVDSNGDTQVDLYPVPDGVYNLRFNIFRPQDALENNADRLYVPTEPVIYGALARALAERGEDGGIQSNEMYAMYQQSLGDAIAIESSRYIEEGEWISV